MFKRFILPVMLLGFSVSGYASSLQELLYKFAEKPVKSARFTEKRISSYLKEPVITKGDMEFRAPDTLLKHIVSPGIMTQKIVGDDLYIFIKGKDKQYIYLPYQPELETGINAIRWILSGNEKLLKSQFDIHYTDNDPAWKIELLPEDEEISAAIKKIIISGKNDTIDDINIIQVNGDSIETSLYEHK